MKGIILAGGHGSRLHPITQFTSKQLLPVYDKPMIYYPLSTLMLAGLREILIVAATGSLAQFESLLGDGSQWGITLKYAAQDSPDGIPAALLLGEEFVAQDRVALILGDNIFYGDRLTQLLRDEALGLNGATIFAYRVSDPQRFGVAELDAGDRVLSLEEKPASPRSSWAVTGLYFYDSNVMSLAKSLKPSRRGELEVTDLNRLYLERGNLRAVRLGRGNAWLDMGTPDALLEASQFVQALERRQGLKIACPEEVALLMGFIERSQFERLAHAYPNSAYRTYLLNVLRGDRL